ncbi:hypothetical protein EYF80_013660 [Liparis tanakae]|uniref:Uncharacterized protein n=1 Tax=Liparis tanakae TaxID=230148 RepID=A0A4Z2IDG8_9TELE|nr:hypothetical protein EYF80_013660 [Liparis tanakae]
MEEACSGTAVCNKERTAPLPTSKRRESVAAEDMPTSEFVSDLLQALCVHLLGARTPGCPVALWSPKQRRSLLCRGVLSFGDVHAADR